jgi:hypothetical protein
MRSTASFAMVGKILIKLGKTGRKILESIKSLLIQQSLTSLKRFIFEFIITRDNWSADAAGAAR